jgi:Putative prokaryotic signal transducing protein
MSLVRVFTPSTEGELLSVVAMLGARNVPCFVRNAGVGSLFPGALPIESLNVRAIMVPEEREAEALALIEDFRKAPLEPDESTTPGNERDGGT